MSLKPVQFGKTVIDQFGHYLLTTFPVADADMAALDNLLIGITIGRGWRNLAQARRYYDAHPDQAMRLLLARPAATL